jgi:hypothetical protein
MGERVRRKLKRLGTEDRRRVGLQRTERDATCISSRAQRLVTRRLRTGIAAAAVMPSVISAVVFALLTYTLDRE